MASPHPSQDDTPQPVQSPSAESENADTDSAAILSPASRHSAISDDLPIEATEPTLTGEYAEYLAGLAREAQLRASENAQGKVKKEFPCPGCNGVFERLSALRQHLLSHTGEKPHSCDACGRRFSIASNLRRHLRTCKVIKMRIAQGITPLPANALTTRSTEDLRSVQSGHQAAPDAYGWSGYRPDDSEASSSWDAPSGHPTAAPGPVLAPHHWPSVGRSPPPGYFGSQIPSLSSRQPEHAQSDALHQSEASWTPTSILQRPGAPPPAAEPRPHYRLPPLQTPRDPHSISRYTPEENTRIPPFDVISGSASNRATDGRAWSAGSSDIDISQGHRFTPNNVQTYGSYHDPSRHDPAMTAPGPAASEGHHAYPEASMTTARESSRSAAPTRHHSMDNFPPRYLHHSDRMAPASYTAPSALNQEGDRRYSESYDWRNAATHPSEPVQQDVDPSGAYTQRHSSLSTRDSLYHQPPQGDSANYRYNARD